MTTRFLIAKYAPDLRRMEPKNIGVIVWRNGDVCARFLGEQESIPRRIELREKGTYNLWLESWRAQISKAHLEMDDGSKITRSSTQYIDALQTWSRGNYVLVEGGEVAGDSQLSIITDSLFGELVLTESDQRRPADSESPKLKRLSDGIMKKAGILDRPDCRTSEPHWYKVYDVMQSFEIDYVVGPLAQPYSLYHRVVLGQQSTFESMFYRLDWFRRSRNYTPDRCAALVITPDDDDQKAQTAARMEQLGKIVTVIPVDQAGVALNSLAAVAAMNGAP